MPQTNANATKKSNRKIVVPPAVKEKWGGAKLKITDKQSNKDTVISLTLGEPTKFEAGNLTLTADSFLPSFFISGDTITSIDAEDKNPGVKLLVQEGDKELMDNWIFAKMPNIHAFSHPKWSITLIGGIPK